jgi:putative endonuclease
MTSPMPKPNAPRPNHNRSTGQLGEQLACEALQRRGYEIVAQGWHCPRGEVDIVARDGECWVFVEVKTRRGRRAGLPEDGLTRRKIARVTEIAQVYLSDHVLVNVNWRVDFVAVELDSQDRVLRLQVVPGILLD